LDNKEIYDRLIQSYSEENLTGITTKLISLYQGEQYEALREVMSIVSEFTGIREEKIQRCFAYLLKLYHPDRTRYYLRFIRENYHAGNLDPLHDLEHIFQIEQLDFSDLPSSCMNEDIDYSPEEVWDDSDPGFDVFEADLMTSQDEFEEASGVIWDQNDFASAVKRKIYGHMDIDLPVYLLEDLEDIEMAEYEIDSLEGVRFCKYAVTMDLSGNNIDDITEIAECRFLRELYLSHNQISIIDALSNLEAMTQLDLSYNLVDDLSPLFTLEHLEYVNIIGNPVPEEQVDQLKKKGILVVI
jgi:hypothetical protein